MNPPAIRLIEGLHLTATNRRHIAQMLAQGLARGATKALAYTLEPLPDCPNRWRYTIAKQERDDWGRPQVRHSRGIIDAAAMA